MKCQAIGFQRQKNRLKFDYIDSQMAQKHAPAFLHADCSLEAKRCKVMPEMIGGDTRRPGIMTGNKGARAPDYEIEIAKGQQAEPDCRSCAGIRGPLATG
ncbi:MAG TPA: hypothetical protein VEC01_20325 [Noviherbaspirillum sp.]|uniref:hypothetical protein n=1 Tax=Noviherbaspirillum sp. TaxID=1926288 RepID=UPI002D61D62C|nr:hypothetical protein [Noviherbaspirillum sp.]HYD97679.1 hypothetical protein [Noviherbaspirillum sp.]